MTPDKLIIQDIEFQEYPIDRVYSLGGKTVIQIGNSSATKTISQLETQISDLEDEAKLLTKENRELDGENDDLQGKYDKLLEQFDSALLILEEDFEFNPDYNESIGENLGALKNFLDGKAHSRVEWESLEEELEGLKIDNNALADTVFRQEQTIAQLEESLLAAQEN